MTGRCGDHHDPSVRVALSDADAAADELFSILMGEDVDARRKFYHPQRQGCSPWMSNATPFDCKRGI